LEINGTTLPLAAGKGFEYVSEAANAAGVVLVEP
jgi:hypothetical protein